MTRTTEPAEPLVHSNVQTLMALFGVDLEGFVAPSTPGTGLYTALAPQRVCDTRAAGPWVVANHCDGNGASIGTLRSGGVQTIKVTGIGGVPSSGVSAVVRNITVTDTSPP